jgi:hypothetical protein
MSDYATQIAEKAFAILSDALRGQFKTFRKAPMLTFTASDMPALGVFILRERWSPDGDPNVAEPKFVHQLTLGISGSVAVSTDEQNEYLKLRDLMSQVDTLLLSNPSFVSMTEGVTLVDQTAQYATVGETPLAEFRKDMTVQFRSNWEPAITDDLKVIHIDAQFPDKAHADAGTEQIVREYDIEQN